MRSLSALTVGIVAIATATVLLAGCASRGTSTPDPRLDGEWRLASASDDRGSLRLGDAVVTLIIGDVRHTGGQSPCTEYTASVTGSSGSSSSAGGSAGVVFVKASTASTSDCPDEALGELEQRYMAVLNDAHFAAVENQTLVLSSNHGSLRYTRGAELKTLALEGTTWVLDSLAPTTTSGLDVAPPGDVSVRFDGKDNFMVSGACSTLAAVYSSADQRISVTTLRGDIGDGGMCTEADAATAERILRLVGGAFTVDIQGSTLFVTSIDNGEHAVFRARAN